jgi:hypothetical protein
LDLNGLQVTEEFIGRGSLALWGAEEAEPEPPPENGKEGVYKCRRHYLDIQPERVGIADMEGKRERR